MTILHYEFIPTVEYYGPDLEGDDTICIPSGKVSNVSPYVGNTCNPDRLNISPLDIFPFETFPPCNAELERIILDEIASDRIKFARNLAWLDEERIMDYIFDPESNLIHIWIDYGEEVYSDDLKSILTSIDVRDGGPDGWMEGDISIVDDEVAEKYGYGKIELHPYVHKVSIVSVQKDGQRSEVEVDIAQVVPKLYGTTCPN